MRKPTDKGGVERAIRYLKTRFFPARVIPSLESGNVGLLHFLETVAMQRGHPTQKDRTGGEVFAEEKARLLPLPSAAIRNEVVTSVPADSPAFAFINANRYSVTPEAADRMLRLVATAVEVRPLDGDRIVGQSGSTRARV